MDLDLYGFSIGANGFGGVKDVRMGISISGSALLSSFRVSARRSII